LTKYAGEIQDDRLKTRIAEIQAVVLIEKQRLSPAPEEAKSQVEKLLAL